MSKGIIQWPTLDGPGKIPPNKPEHPISWGEIKVIPLNIPGGVIWQVNQTLWDKQK